MKTLAEFQSWYASGENLMIQFEHELAKSPYIPVPSAVQRFLDDGWKMTDRVPFFDTAPVLSGYYDTIYKNFVTADGKRILADGFTIRILRKTAPYLS